MTHALRRIDHVVVAVHDLDAAGIFYERLGFQVGARNRHPWGTENRLIQFGSSFIELIAIWPDTDAIPGPEEGWFSFGGFVRDYLRAREGLAMLALDSDDARADAARFAREGIRSFEPFFFERSGRRPDGSETHVAFTLAFAVDPRAPEAAFFVCQQHFPSIQLLGGQMDVVPDTAGRGDLQFRSVAIGVPDLAAQARQLMEAGIPFAAERDGLSIPAGAAFGLVIRFTRSPA